MPCRSRPSTTLPTERPFLSTAAGQRWKCDLDSYARTADNSTAALPNNTIKLNAEEEIDQRDP